MLSSSAKLPSSAGGSGSSEDAHREVQQCCCSPSLLSAAVSLFSHQGAEPESEDPGVLGELRTGKWRVPTCRDYVDLFRSLLSCDQTMVNTAAESHRSAVTPLYFHSSHRRLNYFRSMLYFQSFFFFLSTSSNVNKDKVRLEKIKLEEQSHRAHLKL